MNSKQYDFNGAFVDYDGNAYKKQPGVETSEDILMSKTLSDNLKTLTKGDIMKLDDWARALHKGELLILDNTDRQELERIIKNDFPAMSIHVKRQLIDVLANGQEIKT